jgi:hypothetical protein
MVTVQLKIVEEGLKHPLEDLRKFITSQLFEDDILVSEEADLTLKIKFTYDNGQDLILLQLRDTASKAKLGEKVIHYFEDSWIIDTSAEAHALVASLANVSH